MKIKTLALKKKSISVLKLVIPGYQIMAAAELSLYSTPLPAELPIWIRPSKKPGPNSKKKPGPDREIR